MPNKVLHLAYGLDIGGLERVMINTINGLPEYEHTILVLTTYSEKFSQLLPQNVRIIAMNKSAGHSWKMYSDIYKQIRTLKPNVVHTYNLATLEYQVCAFLAGTKVRIHAEHGRDIYDPDGSNVKYQWLRRLISPFVGKFVSVSRDLHEWILNVVKIPSRKATLIYNGVNTEKFVPASKTPLDESQKNKIVFGTVGRLAPIKNQSMLIDAFATACKQDPNFAKNAQLTLVGDGPERAKLEALAKQFNLEHKIWFAGARHDMERVYHSFDFFVLSSLAEGIPMTILEALASGKPTISTSVGGIPEIIEDEKTGYLSESHDPNKFASVLLAAFHAKNDLSSNAREMACTKFSEVAMLDAYLNEYKAGGN